jgi:predicted RNA-binding Zn ribbon-like protein
MLAATPAGRLSLDLWSTLLWRYRAPVEQLQTPDDLVRWLDEAGVRPVPAVVRDRDVRAARTLREAIYAVAHDRIAGRPLDEELLATINATAARPDPAPALAAHGGAAWSADAPVSAALSRIARDAIELLAGPSDGRLRECAASDCAFLFLDASRPGTRRWCAMNRCGNREHVREHRRRHRTRTAPGGPRDTPRGQRGPVDRHEEAGR